jgi:hypothetical protein
VELTPQFICANGFECVSIYFKEDVTQLRNKAKEFHHHNAFKHEEVRERRESGGSSDRHYF